MGWREEILKKEPEPAASPAEGTTDWRSFVKKTVPGGVAETPTGRSNAVIQPIEGSGLGFMPNLKGNIPEDPETRQRVMAESAGLKPEDMGTINNRPVFRNARGDVEYADEGAASTIGAAMANAPEMIGAVAGSLASPVAGTALGATAGKAGKQILSALVFDEPQTTAGNVKGLATEAVINAVPAAALKIGTTAYNRAAVRNADKFDLPQAQALQRRIKDSTGIDLDFAQAGNIPQLRAIKKWAAKYPSDAQEIIQALDTKQAGQVADAVTDRVLKALGREQDASVLAGAGVNAARNAIQLAKLQREAETAQLYEAAKKQIVSGDPALTELLQRPSLKAAWARAEKLASEKGEKLVAGKDLPARTEFVGGGTKTVPGGHHGTKTIQTPGILDASGRPMTAEKPAEFAKYSGKALHYLKMGLDDLMKDPKSPIARNELAALAQTKERLLGWMDEKLPGYGAARAKYAEISRSSVDPLESGLVGILSKIEGPAMVRQVASLMNDVLANPQTVKGLRLALTNQQGASAWNSLVKLSLAKKFDRAARETQGGDVVNLAGKFRQAVIGSPERARAMDQALDPSVRPVFNDMMDALQLIAREARSRGGSDTAFNLGITSSQKGGAMTALGRFITAPAKTVREALDEKVLEKNAVAFAEALTDQKKLTALKELRKMKPSTERALAILSVVGIGQNALEPVADSALKRRPDAAPQSYRAPQQTVQPAQ